MSKRAQMATVGFGLILGAMPLIIAGAINGGDESFLAPGRWIAIAGLAFVAIPAFLNRPRP
jgi:hypothetical protein